ncbi:hypothetical protein [Parapedobacter composti]|uniref:hypothetical protein n=1 Tax=Parapedobacter composti TaxID=623281 RepID=UPI001113941D|nr:hypothetical protein [Parapedobacter composti]
MTGSKGLSRHKCSLRSALFHGPLTARPSPAFGGLTESNPGSVPAWTPERQPPLRVDGLRLRDGHVRHVLPQRGFKGVWGLEDSPMDTCHAAAGQSSSTSSIWPSGTTRPNRLMHSNEKARRKWPGLIGHPDLVITDIIFCAT